MKKISYWKHNLKGVTELAKQDVVGYSHNPFLPKDHGSLALEIQVLKIVPSNLCGQNDTFIFRQGAP